MLNPELFRRDPARTREALARRGPEAVEAFDAAVETDARWRAQLARVEAMRAEHKARSKAIRGKPSPDELEAMRRHREELAAEEALLQQIEAERERLVRTVPNVPDPSVPVGADEHANVVVRSWGTPRQLDFQPLPHWELGERLGIIDLETGAKLAGARFFVLKGAGALLQRALVNLMLDVHVRDHGYTEVHTPYMVREEIMVGSGQLPKFRDNLYHDAEEDLWLIPTSEVPLVNLYNDTIIPPGQLPILVTAQSPCFRREKVAAGKDIRGIKRVKQFYKVEMVRVVEPADSMRHLDELVANAEDIFQRLELPYQVMLLCTGDLGFAMTKTWDINVWAAGSQEWLECSSCSNAADYQARRAGMRFRREEGAPTEYPHTLNGSGVAIPRTMIALLENNQQPDGSVLIPTALHPYMGGLERIVPPGA